MVRCQSEWPQVPGHFSQRPLPDHPGVKRGVLPNGLRYVMLQNAMPPQRFEAHIELHVGSIDEEPHEQGIAHMMEHVCFLGSRKRQGLVGTGSRSNALTDFQHTIYHIHAPNKLENGRDMFIPALGALNEIAFEPEMLNSRIEKERKAVLAEMQQVNDMEYRIETWTLSGLHETNKLGTQFPIGKEEQIKSWTKSDLKSFHEKWYYPGNATLYVVGDLTIEEMETGISKVFQGAKARHKPSPDTAILEPVWGAESADSRSLFRRKIARHRPEQLHNFGLPMIGTIGNFTDAACFDAAAGGEPWHGPLRIFRNELLEGLQLNFYSKAPVRPLRSQEDILYLVCARILIGVVQFRIVSRYSSNHAPVQIDHSDSFREGCAVTSITVNADTRDWRNALACVVQELRAVCDYGITDSEQHRYMEAMLKDVEKGVVENDTVPSEDHLNFIMTSDVFDHVVMHPDQSFQVYKEVAPMVTKEQIITTAKWMFGFLAYYGKAMAPPPTAIVVCTPTQVYEEQSGEWSPFQITEEEIVELLLTVPDKSKEEALNQVDVPDSLMKRQLETLLAGQPVDAVTAWRATSRKVDEATGITQLMLPNGARVNYACTTNESQGTMRILVPGGRSAEEPGEVCSAMVGIRTVSESGAVSDFSRDQIELFAISNGMSVHLDLNLESSYVDSSFTLSDNGLVSALELLHLLFTEPRWELPAFVRAQQAYKAQAYSVEKSMEKSTLDRLMKLMYRNNGRVSEPMVDDLNKLSLAKVRKAVAAQLRPQDFEINLVADFEGLTQHKVAEVEGAMSTGKHHREGLEQEEDAMETQALAAAKERRLFELDEVLWKYLGSVPPSEAEQAVLDRAPVIGKGEELAEDDRECSAHIDDSDARAVANLGGGAPNRWGKGDAYHSEAMAKKNFSWDTPNSPVKDHPLYPSTCLLAMREVVNTRLFSRVRDSLGLSYDCSFELSMLSRLEAGWYTCTVSSHPSRIREAVSAAKDVLKGVLARPISELELSSARRTLLRRHETDLQSNEQWISLLSYLQSDAPKDMSCVRDIEMMLSKLTCADAQNAFLSLLTDSDQIFVSVTTAGPESYVAGSAAAAAAPQNAGAQKQLVSLD
jgi:predicted Zn-dependent peptidase